MEIITKADGTPTKSRVFAVNFLKSKGISEECLISKEGKFYYEEPTNEEISEVVEVKPTKKEKVENVTICHELSWETPVFYDGDNNTTLKLKPADVNVKIVAKHPAGQSLTRPYNAFELCIGSENFIMSESLCKQIFEVEGV